MSDDDDDDDGVICLCGAPIYLRRECGDLVWYCSRTNKNEWLCTDDDIFESVNNLTTSEAHNSGNQPTDKTL